MSVPSGYVVRLTPDRVDLFNHNYDVFSEPVSEFRHSRNVPLICFIFNNESVLTRIAKGKRGQFAGTDLRKLNMSNFFVLTTQIHADDIISEAPLKLKKTIKKKIENGGLLPLKSFQAVLQIVRRIAQETTPVLSVYSAERTERIQRLPTEAKVVLAEQKEAVATALAIADISRDELQGWDVNSDGGATSFLDGLEKVRLQEDQMVIHDLSNIPGYDVIKQVLHSYAFFENSQSKLTVVLANRLPLEKQLGVDLIYYNETFKCFLMIQYKAMEEEGAALVFRFPNAQLTKEIDRMNDIKSELKKVTASMDPDGYRLNENPFFLKICPRIAFNPDNITLIKGMYLPLDYWELLSKHSSMSGPRRGKRLTYKNSRRYLDNTDFIKIASGGWVGTNIEQSKLLENVIRSTIESNRTVAIAINEELDHRHRQFDDEDDVTIERGY